MLPYYIKVREYSDLENRDLWEYQLALKPEEVERVVRHLWELLPAYYQYFFFDENCAYHLLGLLQVARPELELTKPFRWWALPSDTVRILAREPGLVANVVYRPANATLIAARLETMSKAERGIAKELSQGKPGARDALRALPPEEAAAALETGARLPELPARERQGATCRSGRARARAPRRAQRASTRRARRRASRSRRVPTKATAPRASASAPAGAMGRTSRSSASAPRITTSWIRTPAT